MDYKMHCENYLTCQECYSNIIVFTDLVHWKTSGYFKSIF